MKQMSGLIIITGLTLFLSVPVALANNATWSSWADDNQPVYNYASTSNTANFSDLVPVAPTPADPTAQVPTNPTFHNNTAASTSMINTTDNVISTSPSQQFLFSSQTPVAYSGSIASVAGPSGSTTTTASIPIYQYTYSTGTTGGYSNTANQAVTSTTTANDGTTTTVIQPSKATSSKPIIIDLRPKTAATADADTSTLPQAGIDPGLTSGGGAAFMALLYMLHTYAKYRKRLLQHLI